MKIKAIAAGFALGAIALTGCGAKTVTKTAAAPGPTQTQSVPGPTVTVQPKPAQSKPVIDPLLKKLLDGAWNQQSSFDQATACAYVKVSGGSAAADTVLKAAGKDAHYFSKAQISAYLVAKCSSKR